LLAFRTKPSTVDYTYGDDCFLRLPFNLLIKPNAHDIMSFIDMCLIRIYQTLNRKNVQCTSLSSSDRIWLEYSYWYVLYSTEDMVSERRTSTCVDAVSGSAV
jgi:hypothetical protein